MTSSYGPFGHRSGRFTGTRLRSRRWRVTMAVTIRRGWRSCLNAQWESMRAGDADRERAADLLKAALGEGRLDYAEHRRRLDAVMACHTYGELQAQVADLPAGPVPFSITAPSPLQPVHVNPWARYAPVPARPVEPLAKAALILGILAPFTSITSLPAIITGHIALARIRQTGDDGRSLAIVGLTLGWVVTVFTVLMMLALATVLWLTM